MIDRIGEDLSFFRQAIGLRHQRQEVLAANIANADTPYYQARDFDFGAALRRALSDTQAGLRSTSLTLTSGRHISASAQPFQPEPLLYRQPFQPSLDGNTVDMDIERVQFAENAMRYQAGLSIISSRIKTMMTALQS